MLFRKTAPTFKNWLTTVFILLLLSSAGCTEQNGNVAMVTTAVVTATLPTVAPTEPATPTLTAVVTPLPTITLAPTATTTPLPSLTPIPTTTPFPTLTPLPTIPPEQRGQAYADLMSTNGGCELPCWWGFEMGVASLEEVRQFYTTFGAHFTEQIGRNGLSVLYVLFVDPQIEAGIQVPHTFIAKYDIVLEAKISIIWDPNYQIESLLQRLGQPSEIWMWTIPEPYEGILPARFRLYFPNKGVFVSFATWGERIGDSVHVCFNKEGTTVRLWNPTIWDPDGTKSIVDAANEGETLEGHPIGEVSNWSTEEFYTILVNPTHTDCLETPANLWPSP